jgi:hypothetical protein
VSRPGADGQAGSADPIRCHCGEVLADRIYEKTVVIDGVEFQFQRESDLLTCPGARTATRCARCARSGCRPRGTPGCAADATTARTDRAVGDRRQLGRGVLRSTGVSAAVANTMTLSS